MMTRLSCEPDTIRSESALTHQTPSVCPKSVLTHSPDGISQSFTITYKPMSKNKPVLSSEAVTSFPCGIFACVESPPEHVFEEELR